MRTAHLGTNERSFRSLRIDPNQHDQLVMQLLREDAMVLWYEIYHSHNFKNSSGGNLKHWGYPRTCRWYPFKSSNGPYKLRKSWLQKRSSTALYGLISNPSFPNYLCWHCIPPKVTTSMFIPFRIPLKTTHPSRISRCRRPRSSGSTTASYSRTRLQWVVHDSYARAWVLVISSQEHNPHLHNDNTNPQGLLFGK